MDFVNIPLFAASVLVFLSVLSGVVSTRVGFPVLLVFLLAGALAGEDGPGGYPFNDFVLSFWVGNAALAVILLDGGLRTAFSTFRTGLKPSLLLATLGVAISAGITGVGASLLLDLDWRSGLLLGAVVGSTDAAAVFAMLKSSGARLNERVAATLEIESGLNDPMAVYLTLALIAVILQAQPGATGGPAPVLLTLLQQFGWGTLFGLVAGLMAAWLMRRLPPSDAGITALLLVSAGLAVFAATGLVGGSGFLAVYLFGMMLGNRATERTGTALSAMDGYAWLSQAGMFLLLGLLVTPSQVLTVAGPALGVAALLMLVARPVAVWACLAPFRFRPREIWFISWVGLRGAVPIVLAVFPLMAGVPDAMLLFNVAFVVVVVSLLLQGTTIGWAARRLQVALPEAADEKRTRAVFGDFVLDGASPLRDVCAFYGLPLPEAQADAALSSWMATALGRPAVVGDEVPLGSATLVVRAMEGARISMVGLKLPAEEAA
ncbi:potassium/proton antiporter [Ramlibacter rhizophilus]|uniref:Potassium/proton antiporter n=1 Tax=Ramlibacter rhizophilus TaxID=1781167 RepID=A0A4Z0BC61_9BURK|nr:potassium/proton antiporter [Ramlibacter rhizophilus]TFY96802.1 potassium/proton antiporter [Ramlibacter rhizophilus]